VDRIMIIREPLPANVVPRSEKSYNH
jgi:hypothetical protein